MLWPAILLLALAIAGWFLLERMSPWHCPHCRRFNVFRRRRTGLTFSDLDADGGLIQGSAETLCKCCGRHYWISWDDFNGRSASKELQRR